MQRRVSALLLFVLLLGACAGSSQTAVSAGDDSLSREDLFELTTSLDPSIADRQAVPTPSLIANATLYLRSQAFLDHFDSIEVDTADARGEAQDLIGDTVAQGAILELEFGSEPFEALVDIVTVGILLEQTGIGTMDPALDAEFPDQVEIFEEFTDDFSVESRIGSWDPATFTVQS